MTLDALVPPMTRAIQWHDRLLQNPALRVWEDTLVFMFSISGAFWLLSRILGRVALLFHRMLDHSLAELFAVVYNLALALLYSSVLVFAIFAERAGRDDFLAHEAVGFAWVYLMLGAVFSERSGKIGEYALPGYWAGLISYILFCLRSQYIANPVTAGAYKAVAWALRGWFGRLALALTVFGVLSALSRSLVSLLSRGLRRLTSALPQRRIS